MRHCGSGRLAQALCTGQIMQRRSEILLRFCSRFRGRKPTLFEVFSRQPRSYCVAMLVLLSAAALYYQYAGGELAYVFLGMAAGAVLRDFRRFLAFVRDWPTLDRFINWPAVEQELAHFRGPGA